MKMKQKIVFATNNAHKLEEVAAMLGDAYEVLSLRAIGCNEDIPETADTFAGNAMLKYREQLKAYDPMLYDALQMVMPERKLTGYHFNYEY